MDLDAAYGMLDATWGELEPDDPNFRRVRTSGGSENRLGEVEGGTRDEHEFTAVVWTSERRSQYRGGGYDVEGDLRLSTDTDVLQEGDRVERLSDGKAYEVTDSEDLGGPDQSVGWVYGLIELEED